MYLHLLRSIGGKTSESHHQKAAGQFERDARQTGSDIRKALKRIIRRGKLYESQTNEQRRGYAYAGILQSFSCNREIFEGSGKGIINFESFELAK